MRKLTSTPIEMLETRRLLTNYSLDVQRASSPITVTATLDGRSLTQTGGGDAFLNGSSLVSNTRTGVAFSDANANGVAIGNTGTGIGIGSGSGSSANAGLSIVDANDQLTSFTFGSGDGDDVSVSNVSFAFDSSRIRVKSNNRFSTRPIDATLQDGSLGVSGVALPADLTGFGDSVDSANGRLRKSSSSIRVTVPFSFTIHTQVARFGYSQTLDVTFSGTMDGVGVNAPSATPFTGIIGSNVASGITVSPFAKTSSSGRAADDIFG